MNYEILEFLICDASTNPADFLATDLNLDFTRVVYKNAVTTGREVKRNTFVGLVG